MPRCDLCDLLFKIPLCALLFLNVEAELHHVAIFDHIVFAFDTQFPGFTSLRERPKLNEVVKMDGFSRNEASFKVGMNDSGGRRSLIPSVDGPGSSLFLSGS